MNYTVSYKGVVFHYKKTFKTKAAALSNKRMLKRRMFLLPYRIFVKK